MKKILTILLITMFFSAVGQGNFFWSHNYSTEAGELPTVFILGVENITPTTAVAIGTVTDGGGDVVISKGFVWNTSGNPTLTNYTGIIYNESTSVGEYEDNITGLTCLQIYYITAFATNSIGTAYDTPITFTAGQADATTEFRFSVSVKLTNLTVYSGTTLIDAQNMCNGLHSPDFLTATSGLFNIVGVVEVGKIIHSFSKCPLNYTGYYVWRPNYPLITNTKIVYILNGVIQSITNCP